MLLFLRVGLFIEMQCVSHTFFFGSHIFFVVGGDRNFDGHIFHDFESVGLQTYTFDRIVRQQAHFMYAQFMQDLSSDAVFTFIGQETEMYVGIYGIVSFFLQLSSY